MAAPMAASFRSCCKYRINNIYFTLKRSYIHDKVRVRFAPSPTGYMHLGGLRTALYNFLFAKSNGGKFILRIEDTDQTRLIPGAIEKLENVLSWVGLTPDEGPTEGGDFGPYLQSQRLYLYRENVEKLLQSGHCYRCFCTQKRLDLLRKDQLRRGENTGYDNKCRDLTDKTVQEKLSQNIPHVIRFKYEPIHQKWHDLVYGEMTSGPDKPEGDFIVMKSDDYPTYHFANVVDDHCMEVSHVLRGEEWHASTPKHLQMYEAFGWQSPQFAHLPLILNRDGTKLSKRQDDIRVQYFRDKGYEPDAVLNYVTSVGSGFTDSTAGKTLQELIGLFSVETLICQSARLQPERLEEYNRDHLQRLFNNDKTQLINRTRDMIQSKLKKKLQNHVDGDRILSDQYIEDILAWSLEHRISQLDDLFHSSLEFIWLLPSDEQLLSVLKLEKDAHKVIQETIKKLTLIDSACFNFDSVKEVLFCFIKEHKMKTKKYMGVMRSCLGGAKEGPPVAEMMTILGKDETLNRLKYIHEKLKIDK